MCCISHVATLPVITRVMTVRNQTSQAFVTSSCPFCDCPCQFVYGPWNVWSTSLCQIHTFQDELSADFRQFSTVSNFSFFEFDGRQDMVSRPDTVGQSIRNICPRTSSHDLPCQKTKRSHWRAISPNEVTFQLLWRRFVIRTYVSIHQQYFLSICSHVECIPSVHVVKR